MSIPTACSHCHASYTLNDALLGKTVRCKNCQQAFVVEDTSVRASRPAPAEAPRGSAPARPRRRQEVEDDWDDEEERQPRPIRKQGSSVMPILLIGGGVAGLLVLVCCGVGGYFIYEAKRTGDEFVNNVQNQMDQEMARQNGMDPNNAPGGQPAANPPAGPAFPGANDQGRNPPPEQPRFPVGKTIASVAEALDALKDRRQRQLAAEYMARTPVDAGRQAEVARALEPLLEDQETFVRLAAAKALRTWADKDSVPALIRGLDQKFAPFSGEIQGNVMAALGRLADPRGADAVAPYLANAFVNEDARRSLKEMGPVAEKAVLKYYFHRDGGAQQRARDLIRGYGTKPSAIVAQGVEELKANELDRRRAGLAWFAQAAQADADSRALAAPALAALLDDNDPFLRDQAAKALVVWATPDVVPDLIKALKSDSGTVRQSALRTLGKLKDERAVVPVTLRLTDFFDRKLAAEALINIGPKAEPTVLTGLTNSDRGVRLEVCRILGAIGTKNSLKPLQAAAVYARAKRETDVLEAALLAIQSIGNRLKAPMP